MSLGKLLTRLVSSVSCASIALMTPGLALGQSATGLTSGEQGVSPATLDDGWPHRITFEAPSKNAPRQITPTYPSDYTVGPSESDPRGMEGKVWGGVLYGMLGGVSISIGTYLLSQRWLNGGDYGSLNLGQAKGAANFAVLASMPVGYAFGSGLGVYRVGESYGHRGQRQYTLGGAIIGSAFFGLMSLAASNEIMELAGPGGQGAVEPILMSGMALGSLIGSTIGAVAGYEIFDNHKYEFHPKAIRIAPTALSDGQRMAPGLGLMAQF